MYVQNSPFLKKSKVKGGGTKKVCLPASKVRSKALPYVIGLKKKIGLTLQQESHAEINR